MTATTSGTDSRILVRKYGGSSLATVERIGAVARDLRRAREAGYRLVAVVSAMGKTTDELAHLARSANPHPPRRELDMLLSVGERITMSLLSMALATESCPAISFTGSQCGIITDTSHTDARILEVKADRVREALTTGKIVIVAGFQGVSLAKEITTLGRGGSDTTAVALAAALGAIRCEILKDVDGVMSADPRLVAAARRHATLDYEQMRQIAVGGCGVVHLRAVEYAARYRVPLFVGSSFHDGPGTLVGEPETLEPARSPAAAATEVATTAETATDPDPGVHYLPLTMHVQAEVARLAVKVPPELANRWRDEMTLATADGGLLAEWLDESDGFRWQALGTPQLLQPLAERLRPLATADGVVFIWEDDRACITLTGCRPDSWLAVTDYMSDLLQSFGITDATLLPDGSTLRLVVPAVSHQQLARSVHHALFEASGINGSPG